jgi:hypothetical protein
VKEAEEEHQGCQWGQPCPQSEGRGPVPKEQGHRTVDKSLVHLPGKYAHSCTPGGVQGAPSHLRFSHLSQSRGTNRSHPGSVGCRLGSYVCWWPGWVFPPTPTPHQAALTLPGTATGLCFSSHLSLKETQAILHLLGLRATGGGSRRQERGEGKSRWKAAQWGLVAGRSWYLRRHLPHPWFCHYWKLGNLLGSLRAA